MEKQILEELYGKLRELIPDFETREEGNKNYISYKMQINDKDFETSVVITNGRAVAITGKRLISTRSKKRAVSSSTMKYKQDIHYSKSMGEMGTFP